MSRTSPRSPAWARRALGAAFVGTVLAACIRLPTVKEYDGKQTDDDAGPPSISLDASPTDATYELPPADPHALVGVDPAHGPFSGGQTRVVRGNGFSSKVRVWFGATEVPIGSVTPIDPLRARVVVPAGAPGAVDVSAQNGDDASTRRTLPGGYQYDAFYADPSTGPTSGGTVVTLVGEGTSWNATSTVDVGGQPCGSLTVASPTKITCTVPKGQAGARSVTVRTGNVPLTVLDAFTYADSDNGFKGGLSGGALGAQLKVLVFDDISGDAIPGAYVLAADDAGATLATRSDAAGVALFASDAAALGPRRTVTIAARCKQPTTFVAVAVDTVTAYLDPVLTPPCVDGGDPAVVGGQGGQLGGVTGQLVWSGGTELKRALWTNVPSPVGPDEAQAAYVMGTASDATQPFRLPDAATAVHPDASGDVGYAFTIDAWGGNLALYAVAGIENRKVTPPKFTAYAMGVAQGIAVKSGQVTPGVLIPMDVTLDQSIPMYDLEAPVAGPRGPDRVATSLAIAVGNDGYAILPGMQRTTLSPAPAPILLGGAPALAGGFAIAQYVATAKAGSGQTLATPVSVLGKRTFTDASKPVPLGDFVPVPTAVTPPVNGLWSGTSITIGLAAQGTPPDVIVVDVKSGGGLSSWTIAAPGSTRTFALPDLHAIDPSIAIVPGPVSLEVHAARVSNFSYDALRYRHLSARGWNDYAFDAIPATYAP